MEIETRTEREIERDKRHARVCEAYRQVSSDNPELSPHRIMGAIARTENLTVAGVRLILEKNGVYQSRKN